MTQNNKEVYGCAQEKLPISRALSDPPITAWPTILLAVGGLSVYIATHVIYSKGRFGFDQQTDATDAKLSYPIALLLWSLSAYVCFTPMHDASHGSIASSKSSLRIMNVIIGRLCGFTLGAPFVAFRCLHLLHHKYTNVPGKDPDMWSSLPKIVSSHSWLFFAVMPVQWTTQIWSYIAHYLSIRRDRPAREAQEVLLTAVLTVFYPIISLLRFGRDSYAFWCYALPGYIAIMFLAACFDYLPHRPHDTTNIYQGTNLTALSAVHDKTNNEIVSYVTTPLTPLLLWQNYHVIHHLYPWIPFYRYSTVWYAMEKELLAAKVPVVPLFPLVVGKSKS